MGDCSDFFSFVQIREIGVGLMTEDQNYSSICHEPPKKLVIRWGGVGKFGWRVRG